MAHERGQQPWNAQSSKAPRVTAPGSKSRSSLEPSSEAASSPRARIVASRARPSPAPSTEPMHARRCAIRSVRRKTTNTRGAREPCVQFRPRPGEPVHRARPRTAAARDPRPSATLSAALRPPTFKRRHAPANRQAGHFWRNAAKRIRTCRSAAERAIARAMPQSPRLTTVDQTRNTSRSGAASLA